MALKFKLINEEKNLGVWISVGDLLDLAKICKHRNARLYKKLISDIEYLDGQNYDKKVMEK